MVTPCAQLQAPAQAKCRPSMWLPCCNSLHSHREIWKTEVSQYEFSRAVMAAVDKVSQDDENSETLQVHEVYENGTFLSIFAFTRAEWLDVVELRYKDGFYQVHSFSSGLCPLIVPCALLCNLMCFFAPFLDVGFNRQRIQRIREALTVPVMVVDTQTCTHA